MTNLERLPHVEAELNYLVPMAERPRYYAYEPAPGEPRANMMHEAHTVPIHDMRPIQSEIGLDSVGFALVEQRSGVRDFWDDDEVRRVYYPEAERFIAEATSASRVFIFDHLQRRRVPGAVDRSRSGPRQQPATRVHVDHTAKSGPQRGPRPARRQRGGIAARAGPGDQYVAPDPRPAARCTARGM